MFARGGFALVDFGFGPPDAAGEFKIFAEISDGLFQHRFGAAFAALLGDARVVAGAVQAHAQVGAAFHADFAATGLAGNRPGFAAMVTMSRHLNLRLAIYDLRLRAEKQHLRIS